MLSWIKEQEGKLPPLWTTEGTLFALELKHPIWLAFWSTERVNLWHIGTECHSLLNCPQWFPDTLKIKYKPFSENPSPCMTLPPLSPTACCAFCFSSQHPKLVPEILPPPPGMWFAVSAAPSLTWGGSLAETILISCLIPSKYTELVIILLFLGFWYISCTRCKCHDEGTLCAARCYIPAKAKCSINICRVHLWRLLWQPLSSNRHTPLHLGTEAHFPLPYYQSSDNQRGTKYTTNRIIRK